jgi:SAM-dependent methyltransferase
MADAVEFTGERFLPGTPGEIAYEHWHRYAFARSLSAGRRVLDAACGEGYGTALLAEIATSAIGIDIDAPTIARAQTLYAGRTNLRFVTGSVTAVPLADGAIDLAVSFETIEHLDADQQPLLLAELARVLTPDGVLVISSPNRRRYSDGRDYRNPFHRHELYRDEFARLLADVLPAQRWFHQAPMVASALWSEHAAREVEAWSGDGRSVTAAAPPDAMYYVVVAAKHPAALPLAEPRMSVFVDRDDSEYKRIEATAKETLRLDALLKERDAACDHQTAHIQHLETLLAEHRRVVEARDALIAEYEHNRIDNELALTTARAERSRAQSALAQMEAELSQARQSLARSSAQLAQAREEASDAQLKIGELMAEQSRLDAGLDAQERLITYRQSFRWWLILPWMRMRLWWRRVSGQ